jgi:hypothetical protein
MSALISIIKINMPCVISIGIMSVFGVHLIIYQELKQLHCNENSIYLFQEKELRCLCPNFHIHVPVSGLYVYSQGIGPHICLQQNRHTDPGNIKIAHVCAIPFLGIFVSNFQYILFAVINGQTLAAEQPQSKRYRPPVQAT